jgi:hypothetical protein
MTPPRIPEFGQSDPTDGRALRDWESKYPERAVQAIWREAKYLGLLLFLVPLAILVLWLDYPKQLLRLTDAKYQPILKYGIAWLSGVLGGTLFDLKWLYHSVARQLWHSDRHLWRIFTPHISGGLAFAVVALVSSGLLSIFDRKAIDSLSLVVGIAFLVGYFSDSAIAKLTEIAETLFGASRAKEKHRPDDEHGSGKGTTTLVGTGKSSPTVLPLPPQPSREPYPKREHEGGGDPNSS